MVDFKELREQLSDETIKDVLIQFDVEPVEEDADKIIFPTCCHNLEGGSPKLYYYKNSKLFHCYTDCSETFDIFTLLQKMYKLRGKDISIFQAIQLCNLDLSYISKEEINYHYNDDLRYMQLLNEERDNNSFNEPLNKLKEYGREILHKFSFDYIGLMPWMKEGISVEALQKFNIKYDSKRNAIVIPNFDYNGKLIGIRERFLNQEDIQKGKYRPMYDNGVLYNHPTGRTFYGVYENHKTIERKKICVIFEGEKSVLLYSSIYGCENGIALATLGQNITRDHIQYLLKMKVKDVILAYDTDYEDVKQLKEIEKKYIEKGKILSQYFNVSILMDYDLILPYKSSPIDCGKETFEKLLEDRRFI